MANTSNMRQKTITLGIAMHKPYPVPRASIYLPIHVGAALNPDVLSHIQGDNTGDNISTLNPYFCELTALYWLWKNNDSDYKGLVHYRRYFATNNFFKRHNHNRFERILEKTELDQILVQHPIILPKNDTMSLKRYTHIMPIRCTQANSTSPNKSFRTSPLSMWRLGVASCGNVAHIFSI